MRRFFQHCISFCSHHRAATLGAGAGFLYVVGGWSWLISGKLSGVTSDFIGFFTQLVTATGLGGAFGEMYQRSRTLVNGERQSLIGEAYRTTIIPTYTVPYQRGAPLSRSTSRQRGLSPLSGGDSQWATPETDVAEFEV